MSDIKLKYKKVAEINDLVRTVIVMPKNEVDEIDRWGVPAGMPSRTATIRLLLKQGLEAVRANGNQPTAG